MDKKYELLKTLPLMVNNKPYYRIRALKDFVNKASGEKIYKGDIGGYIANENILSQEGTCWIRDDAGIIYDDKDDYIIKDDAFIGGVYLHDFIGIKLSGDSLILDNETKPIFTTVVYAFKDIMTGKLYTHQQTIECEYDYITIFELEPFDQSNRTRYLDIPNKAFFRNSDIISDKSLSIHNAINKVLEEIGSPFRKLDYDMLVVKENGAGRRISFVK